MAENYLLTGNFSEALFLAQNEDSLAMRFITICLLFLQGDKSVALQNSQDFIEYYKLPIPISDTYKTKWELSKHFIIDTPKLSQIEKTLLLTLIDILETPKPQAESKLQELETLLEQWK